MEVFAIFRFFFSRNIIKGGTAAVPPGGGGTTLSPNPDFRELSLKIIALSRAELQPI
jgi:hypothetical protein